MMALWRSRNGRLGTPRGIAAMLMIVAYLFGGFAHSLSHVHIAKPAAVVSVALDDAGNADEKHALAGHHCHGCFAVAVPAVAQARQQSDLPISKWRSPPTQLTGQRPGTDTPPPKYPA